jgi:D-xylose transport system permease protein
VEDHVATSQSKLETPKAQSGGILGFLRTLEIDLRLLGMVGALIIVWILFHALSGGKFITPRNLWNLAIQTSVVGIMTTGMVFVIVMRHIDLSVGSVLGCTGVIMAVLQSKVFPLNASWSWIVTLLIGLAAGALIGALQGYWIAYQGIPAFVVTLGGLLIFRGAAWLITTGTTIAPLNKTFQLMGGGIEGSIGALWSWIVGALVIFGILYSSWQTRSKRQRLGFPVRPMWAELFVLIASVIFVVAFVMTMNAYARPKTDPPIAQGIPIPVLIVLAVVILMTVIARTTKFGRYIYAMGGNPEAAILAGINTKFITLMVFTLMGTLSALAGAVLSARLQSGGNSMGELNELYVIAAAVIGGTSLAGGYGTVAGAILGAVFMQSLQSGMVLLNLNSSVIQVVIGLVLIGAVWIDVLYRKRAGLREG